MKNIFLVIALLFLSPNVSFSDVGEFRVFEALIYDNKPDMSAVGVEALTAINHTELWVDKKPGNDIPTANIIASLAREELKDKSIAVVDIEHWPLSGCTDAGVRESVYKYVQTLNRMKIESQSTKIGLYAILPRRDYWASISDKNSEKFKQWQKENDELYNIERYIDVFFPSLYTFYNDRDSWAVYAKNHIDEARRINPKKPVYVYLWPQYHVSNKTLGLSFIDKEFWRMQLEVAKLYADGLVLWGGWDFENDARAKWDADAEWWVVTKEFLVDHKLQP